LASWLEAWAKKAE